MDNQHRHIRGYRELDAQEIEDMNRVKDMGVALAALVEQMESIDSFDQRWVSIGKTHLQQGLMALTRAIAQPTFF